MEIFLEKGKNIKKKIISEETRKRKSISMKRRWAIKRQQQAKEEVKI
jgi:hypothetical protein